MAAQKCGPRCATCHQRAACAHHPRLSLPLLCHSSLFSTEFQRPLSSGHAAARTACRVAARRAARRAARTPARVCARGPCTHCQREPWRRPPPTQLPLFNPFPVTFPSFFVCSFSPPAVLPIPSFFVRSHFAPSAAAMRSLHNAVCKRMASSHTHTRTHSTPAFHFPLCLSICLSPSPLVIFLTFSVLCLFFSLSFVWFRFKSFIVRSYSVVLSQPLRPSPAVLHPPTHSVPLMYLFPHCGNSRGDFAPFLAVPAAPSDRVRSDGAGSRARRNCCMHAWANK